MPCFIGLSYETGMHAPGRQEPPQGVNQAYHHAMLAHGHAVTIVRRNVPGAIVGLVHNPPTPIPVTETPADIEAARQVYFQENGQLMGPIFQGQYPAQWLEAQGANAPQIQEGDMEIIAQPGDFLGLNLYAGSYIRAGKEEPETLPWPKQFPLGDLPWIKVTPQTIYWAIRHAAEVFGAKTTYIAENGSAFDDEMTPEGEIIDLDRRELLRNYLISLHRAADEGFDIRGYFGWSVMDNFEWAEGYAKRFGLIHVDYETQKRTPKLSAQWFSTVCRENRVV
jgi:beta-glucosidase